MKEFVNGRECSGCHHAWISDCGILPWRPHWHSGQSQPVRHFEKGVAALLNPVGQILKISVKKTRSTKEAVAVIRSGRLHLIMSSKVALSPTSPWSSLFISDVFVAIILFNVLKDATRTCRILKLPFESSTYCTFIGEREGSLWFTVVLHACHCWVLQPS